MNYVQFAAGHCDDSLHWLVLSGTGEENLCKTSLFLHFTANFISLSLEQFPFSCSHINLPFTTMQLF